VNDFLRLAQEIGASDLHLGVGVQPIMRKFGTLQPLFADAPVLTADFTERLTFGFLDPVQQDNLRNRGDADFCYAPAELGRFRTSVVKQRRGYDMVFRVINTTVKSMDELNLPQNLKQLTKYHNGLVLVTGAVGSGKSTTLASLVNEINNDRHDHIITLEDPIEYKFESKNCHVTQREIHSHTHSFATALRASLREDPDVIMVGEMRDLETIQLAITASETGHLVLATLHTANTSRTLDRILDVFPIDQRDQIRTMVSESLRGIVSQQLVPRADGKGRVLAMEVLVNTPAVAALIRDGKTFMLPGVIQTGRKQGMRLMDDALIELVQNGTITPQEGWERGDNKRLFEGFFKKSRGRH
jgi:twitching motility protein PilT